MSFYKLLQYILFSGFVSFTLGCSQHVVNKNSSSALDSFLASQPESLNPYFKNLYIDGERSAVLNFNQLGLAAFEIGEYEIAKKSLDQAILRINRFYSDDPSAKKARSLWSKEEVKEFKGEPYERAMLYYYRGLLYLNDDDFDNARAAFSAAQIQDRLAEDTEYQADFGIMDLLAAWSSMCIGDKSYAEQKVELALQAYPVVAHEFVKSLPKKIYLFESGGAPKKIAIGAKQEMLSFEPGDNGYDTIDGVIAADLYYQASTRGGRAIDGINKGKAQFKENAEGVAELASSVAVVAANQAQFSSAFGDYDGASAGAAVAGVSALFSLGGTLLSSATETAADTRVWSNLPGKVYISEKPTVKNYNLIAKKNECEIHWKKEFSSNAYQPVSNYVKKLDDTGAIKNKNSNFRNKILEIF